MSKEIDVFSKNIQYVSNDDIYQAFTPNKLNYCQSLLE